MYSCHFFPLINIPTRVTDNTASCLDHIWYNNFNSLISGSFLLDVSDHYPVFTTLNLNVSNDPIKVHFRDQSHEHLNELIVSMNAFQLEFDTVIRYKNVNFQSDWFIKRLWELYNQNCPKRTKTVSYKYYLKPWINEEIKCQINRKHVLFKNYKRRLIPFHVYNSQKKHVTKIIRQSKKKYYATKFKRVRDSIKDTWNTINSVFHRKKIGSDRIVLRDNDGGEINDPTEVSNMFGNYFSNVALNLDRSIPLPQADPI